MLISVLAWPGLALAPFLPLSDKGKWLYSVSAIAFGQITWNVGLLIGGVEAVAKRQEILAWFKRLRRKPKIQLPDPPK
ncbi:hypothetical protein NO2_1019 [Candidatus Termititenax persephonae]|uniref:Uncharacterized protein n=1 Tax=Candidatus Termititenax persephonae TaxID=2218525 RepID=A0A388TH65_9BACT|nr:hypothetical protein NO2_1019 [Candidatus Termititenax persephonae]